MKNVYFVQANMSYGKALYLPYATGCLAAYAWQFENIRNSFRLAGFLFKRDPIDQVMERLTEPAVIAFSCYTWTFEYNKKLAQRVKARWPDCLIVFGGHNISENNDIFPDLPYVDVLMYGEGERSFRALLEAYAGEREYASVPNIAYRRDGTPVTTPRKTFADLNGYLSPYLEGYFDDIVAQNPDTEFCAAVETNRGCPYQCAYCDWCFSSDIRTFPMEKVKREIIWCSRHKVEYIFCADSNFGILKRDLDIARFVVDVKKQYGYPHVFNTCFAKNSNDTVFEISKLFYDNKLTKAATLAYQTVCDTALKNINRKNFTMEAFADLVKKYNENNIPTYTELILGLPGETYDSFCEGFCKLVEAGQQTSFTVYQCQVYSNALMGSKAYRDKFGIKTQRAPLNYVHASVPPQDDITEYNELLVATNDMPFKDMVRAMMFYTCFQCFHHVGLLKYFAVYVRSELDIRYLDFYTALLNYIYGAEGTFLFRLFDSLRAQCEDLSNGEWSYYNPAFGEVGWFLEEGAFMEVASHYDAFWEEIMPFLKTFAIDPDIFAELCKFQRFVIRLPGQETVRGTFAYDFYTYFHDALALTHTPLRNVRNTIEVVIPEPVYNWQDYARKVMLFAKKRGDTVLINDRSHVSVSYL